MLNKLKDLANEVHELQFGDLDSEATLPRVSMKNLTPLRFYRDFVSQNKPCIIEDFAQGWPALKKWRSLDYFLGKLGESQISVDATPNGRADAITNHPNDKTKQYFTLPEELKMNFGEFQRRFTQSKDEILYIQHQNSSFTTEFKELFDDVALDIPFFKEAFGTDPDATNFWLGDERSLSSLHKDPYENIYSVVNGSKIFTLFHPCNVAFLNEKQYTKARWVRENNNNNNKQEKNDWKMEVSEGEIVPWISVNPEQRQESIRKFAPFQYSHQIVVEVKAGETLYLPSLWYHQVAQTGNAATKGTYTCAVNFWFDMIFDAKYSYYNFLHSLDQNQLK